MEKRPDRTTYMLYIDVATISDGVIDKVETLPYVGTRDAVIKENIEGGFLHTPVYPNVKSIRLGKERWATPLQIKGVRALQEHLDIIFECIYNGSLTITSIRMDATNKDWR